MGESGCTFAETKKNKPMEQRVLNKGYVMVSRALLAHVCSEHPTASGSFEAFLRVLIYANYETATVRCNGAEIECKRGESVISFARWAEIFGWTRGKTRRFFQACFDEGSIRPVDDSCASHISIPGYDTWTCAKSASGKGERPKDALFLKFWEDYHEITHTPKTNSARAYLAWKKLSVRERELAVKHIDEFYHHLKNTRFCPQAAAYLKDKAFVFDFDA